MLIYIHNLTTKYFHILNWKGKFLYKRQKRFLFFTRYHKGNVVRMKKLQLLELMQQKYCKQPTGFPISVKISVPQEIEVEKNILKN